MKLTKATKTLSKKASRIQPLAKQLAENEYARENLRRGAESLREGARALAEQRQHPKRKWPKRLLAMGLTGAAAAGAAMAAKGSAEGPGQ
jgi:ferric-dicitrate binding protein FerR (iron transport regulator)